MPPPRPSPLYFLRSSLCAPRPEEAPDAERDDHQQDRQARRCSTRRRPTAARRRAARSRRPAHRVPAWRGGGERGGVAPRWRWRQVAHVLTVTPAGVRSGDGFVDQARVQRRVLVGGSAGRRVGGDPGGRAARLRLGVVGRGVRLRRPHAARLVGRADRAHPPRHRHRAAVGAHAGGDGDGRDHARPPVRRPLHPRARRVRARRSSRAGTASRTRSRWPGRASTSTSCAASSPATRPSSTTASSTTCRSPEAWASARR